ncbi:MAG: ATP-binding protein, partial [Psychrobacillus psychrodurans]
ILCPQYTVALTLAFNYSGGNTWPEYQLYSTSVEQALNFLQEINEKLRQLLMQAVTYLVDTENGVQRRNYGEQAVVNRE